MEDSPGVGAILVGTRFQDGVPDSEQWFMPIPIVLRFPGGKLAQVTIAAHGTRSPVKLKLPANPEKAEHGL